MREWLARKVLRVKKGDTGPQGLKGDKGNKGDSPLTIYNYGNITTGYSEMAIPLITDTVFRVRRVDNNLEYSLLSKGGAARYVDYHAVFPSVTGGSVSTVSGTSTMSSTSSLALGSNSTGLGLRTVHYTVKEWGSRYIVEIDITQHGRVGDSSIPIQVRMASYKY